MKRLISKFIRFLLKFGFIRKAGLNVINRFPNLKSRLRKFVGVMAYFPSQKSFGSNAAAMNDTQRARQIFLKLNAAKHQQNQAENNKCG